MTRDPVARGRWSLSLSLVSVRKIPQVAHQRPLATDHFPKVFHRFLDLQAQKALTAKNFGGYDSLTVI
jgi:hypothetical protein